MTTKTMITTCETLSPIVVGPDGAIVEEDPTPEVAEFLQGWQPSSFPREKDEAESERVGRRIKAAEKQCWFNARKAILKLDDDADASYIEGYPICKDGFGPIEHGWVVRDGVIIDPTLPHDVGLYLHGLEFVGRAGIEKLLATPRGGKCRRNPSSLPSAGVCTRARAYPVRIRSPSSASKPSTKRGGPRDGESLVDPWGHGSFPLSYLLVLDALLGSTELSECRPVLRAAPL